MNLKQFFRVLFRNKTYSILNILGLTVGITSAVLIFLWVEHMVNFNHAIPKSKYICKIAQNQHYGDETFTFFVAPGPLSKTLDAEFPEIKCNTREGGGGSLLFILENSDKSFSESGCYMDATVFDMIGMKFIRGNSQTAFNPAFPIVISEKMAEKMFPGADPIGKTLKEKDRVYEITGVFENLPKNTCFQFEWLIPFRILEKDYVEKGWVETENWRNNWQYCYVEVHPNTNIDNVNKRLNKLIPEKMDGKDNTELFIFPINKMRLYSEFVDGKWTGSGYIRTVRLFFIIGLVILLIACINFMNLSTARSQKRALEVGVKKTFGAKRKGLVIQFLEESGWMTLIALSLSVGLVYLLLPSFNQLVSRELSFSFLNPAHSLGLLGVGLICTFFAGAYPAFYLSSFSPMKTLKKQKVSAGGSASWIRKGLVVFQFSTAVILICATWVIYLQIRHAQNRELGIKKENLITFEATDELKSGYGAVQNELQKTGFVESSGLSSQTMINIGNNGGGYNWPGKDPNTNPLLSMVQVSPGLIDAAGLKLASGKDFSPQDNNQFTSVIINQTLADMMKEEGRVGGLIGQGDDVGQYARVIGIVNDFVFNDIYREKPDPVVFTSSAESSNFLFVRLKPDVNIPEATASIKSALKKFSPNNSFEPVFMDDRFNNLFYSEKLEGKLASLFAGLAIFISCLGLFGLSAFSAEQRTREIGIRKVLGASIPDILTLLGKTYLTLIFIALIIGIPAAWYISSHYLQEYAYRISLSWSIFAGVAVLVILVALLTVSFQSLKAALANPVKSIKVE